MANLPWTRDQRIGAAAIAVTIVFGVASLTVRELRRLVGLEPKPIAYTSRKPPLGETIATRSSTTGEEVPPPPRRLGTARNVVIFNACKADAAHTELAEILTAMYPGTQFDFQYNWPGRWPMQRTRIYYVQAEYRFDASELARSLPGTQDVVDYDKQQTSSTSFPNKPDEVRIVGIQPRRNLAVFLGADYPDILLHVRRVARDGRRLF